VFPTDIATEWGITDEGKADGRNPSVKKITDELLITRRRNISVGKTVKSCSEFYVFFYSNNIYFKFNNINEYNNIYNIINDIKFI